MALPASLNGFTVVPVSYSSATTYLYIRSHTGSKHDNHKTLPPGRTLFLVNVPPDATERELILFFKYCGTVEKVEFDYNAKERHDDEESDEEDTNMNEDEQDIQPHPHKRRKSSKDEAPKVVPLPMKSLRTLRKTGRTAHVVFLDSSSVDRALASSPKARSWPASSEEPSGLSHYASLYENLRPPLDSVRAHADTSIELFEFELAKTKQQSKYRKGEQIVDEDGFTLVTRGGAYGQTLGGGVGVASKQFQRTGQSTRNQTKKEKKEKEGFYAFQKAEKQRKEIMDLKRKWEEDRAKVEKLKASRKFKPY